MLRAPGSRAPSVVTVVADAVRVLGALSVVASAVWLGGVEAALFALVLLGLMMPRFLALPGGLDLASGLTLLAAGWIAIIDLFAVIWWLDLAVHFVANGLLAAMACILLVRVGAIPASSADGPSRHRLGVLIATTACGATLGLLWEFGEWAGHTYLDDSINVGYDDTLGDLAAGGLGSLVAGLALARRA